ncbi:SIR2 family protein [Microbacterium paludicola]|uniref:SIR2 family protein n=1 Tax=Microbacterium paludicola TaxID=300019 RepID=UPI001428CB54|nr:SIR2 family protein [Microbacterium paludicola]
MLLGAGASADAGLKLTSALASAVVERANEQSYRYGVPDWVRALNAVYAGMVGYRGARGENPLAAVNIETLISAVRLLRHRDQHEVAPFVASWAGSLSDFASSSLPRGTGRDVVDAIKKDVGQRFPRNGDKVAALIASIARAALRPDLEKPFAEAEQFVLASLVKLLGEHTDVSYLSPLVELARAQPDGLDVLTLNYDLTVETAAASEGVAVNRGIESWRPGEELSFPPVPGVLNLMKLHGSLDWLAEEQRPGVGAHLRSPNLRVVDPQQPDQSDPRFGSIPWIVVGDREKLATDGPTLVLNTAARLALSRSDHLVVVGYAFGDDHINGMIRDWMNVDERRTMTVLDIAWPRNAGLRAAGDFRAALVEGYALHQDGSHNALAPRMHLVEGRTKARLAQALTERPGPLPSPLASASAVRDGDNLRVDISWLGSDLSNVRCEFYAAQGGNLGLNNGRALGFSTEPFDGDAPSPWFGQTVIDHLPSGGAWSLYLAGDASLPITLRLSGATITGVQEWKGTLSGDGSTDGDV